MLSVQGLCEHDELSEGGRSNHNNGHRHDPFYLQMFSASRHSSSGYHLSRHLQRPRDASLVQVQESARIFSSDTSRETHSLRFRRESFHKAQHAWTERAFNAPDDLTHQGRLETLGYFKHSEDMATGSLITERQERVPLLEGFNAPTNLRGLHFSHAPHRYVSQTARGFPTTVTSGPPAPIVFVVPQKAGLVDELLKHNSFMEVAQFLYGSAMTNDPYRSAEQVVHQLKSYLTFGPKFGAAVQAILAANKEHELAHRHNLGPGGNQVHRALLEKLFTADVLEPTRASIRKAFKGYNGLRDITSHPTSGRTGILFTNIWDLWEYEQTDKKAPYVLRLLFQLSARMPSERWMRNNYLAFTPVLAQYGTCNYSTEGHLEADMQSLFEVLKPKLVYASRHAFEHHDTLSWSTNHSTRMASTVSRAGALFVRS